MADETVTPKLLRTVDLFHSHQIEFIVIGGCAASLLGSPLPTFDIDLCYRRTRPNLEQLAEALKKIHPTLRGAPPDLPFRLDADTLTLGNNFTFTTDFGSLDLLGWVEPLGTYDDLLKHVEVLPLGQYEVKVIGLDDLIVVKRHIRRNKDQAALLQLVEIKRLREGTI